MTTTDASMPAMELEAENNVIGSLLVVNAMPALLNDVRLEPGHFYRESNRIIFTAATRLYERGVGIDPITVDSEVRRNGFDPAYKEPVTRERLNELAAACPAPGNFLHHARLVQDAARWRHITAAGQTMAQAGYERDEAKLATAETMFGRDVVRAGDTQTPQALAQELREHLTADRPDVFPWPLEGLNRRTGGMFRGEVTLLGGWTSHGKSVFVDQTLEAVAKRGYRAHLYINEMVPKQRVVRTVSRHLGIEFNKIMAATLPLSDIEYVLKEAEGLPYGITDATGWSAEEIAHHIRRHRWDFVAVDILHEVPWETEADLRTVGSSINRAAKQAGCHVLATVHLNEHSAHGKRRLPPPRLADVRGSGMLKNQADFVVFVHLFSDEDGTGVHPDGDGTIYIAKGRNTGLSKVAARLEPGRFRWEPRDGGSVTGPAPAVPPRSPSRARPPDDSPL